MPVVVVVLKWWNGCIVIKLVHCVTFNKMIMDPEHSAFSPIARRMIPKHQWINNIMFFRTVHNCSFNYFRRSFSTSGPKKAHKGAVFGIGSFLGLGLMAPFVYSYGKVIKRDVPVS